MSLGVNPVLHRELRERMRSGRAFVVIGVFLALLTLAAFLVFQAISDQATYNVGTRTTIGRTLFETVILVMTLLVLFFVPGITAASIAGERERQTLQPMQVTLLRPRQLLVGKILASMSFLLLLLVAALPVLVTAYALGGIVVRDMFAGVGIVALVTALLTTIVASVTAGMRRVQTATIAGYGVTLAVLVAGPLLFLVCGVLDQASGDDPVIAPPALLAVNPVSIVADATGSLTSAGDNAPLSAISGYVRDQWERADGGWTAVLPDTHRNLTGHTPFPAWIVGSAVLAVLAAATAWRATRTLRTPAEEER